MTASQPPPPGEKAKQGLARYRDTVATAKRRDIDKALRDLRKANAAITVAAVAARAGVSRKTVYKHKDVIATIDQYRNTFSTSSMDAPTDREPAVIAALRRKIAACQAENKELRSVIADQRHTIELLYGQLDELPPPTVTGS